MKRKPPSLDKPYPRHRLLSGEEKEAWRRAMGEASETGPMIEDKNVSSPVPRHKKPSKHPGLPPLKKKPLSPAAIDTRTLAKIRRGSMQVEATLDLHGHTKASAHAALLRFIALMQAQDVRLALIITGKGKGSGGTLRSELPRWLKEPPLKEAVIAYSPASPRDGGEGAWYVRIRKG